MFSQGNLILGTHFIRLAIPLTTLSCHKTQVYRLHWKTEKSVITKAILLSCTPLCHSCRPPSVCYRRSHQGGSSILQHLMWGPWSGCRSTDWGVKVFGSRRNLLSALSLKSKSQPGAELFPQKSALAKSPNSWSLSDLEIRAVTVPSSPVSHFWWSWHVCSAAARLYSPASIQTAF